MFMRTEGKRNGRTGRTGNGRTGNVFFLFRRKERSKEKPFGDEKYNYYLFFINSLSCMI